MEVTELEIEEAGMPTVAAPERCEVAVIYFDKPSRDRALNVCDSLRSRFQDDLAFHFTWWNVRHLTDGRVAHLASHAIITSDLIVFAAGDDTELSPALKKRIENWMRQRHGREGALAVYLKSPSDAGDRENSLGSYLKELASRAHMDYLAPQLAVHADAAATPELAAFHLSPPSHWGINE